MRLAGKPRFWFLVSVLACSAFGQSPISSTIKKLQALHVDEMDFRVSATLAALHNQLKHELRDFVIDSLNRKADVRAELMRAGVRIGSEQERPSYGQIYNVKVDWNPNGLSTWAAFTTALGVSCGEDSSLYLLQREGDLWQLRFAMESDLHKDVSSSYGEFQYVVSEAGQDGHFFVAGANVNPWCSSCLRSLRFEAFTLDPSGAASKVLTKNTNIYFCYDPPYKLSVQSRVLTLEFKAYGLGADMRTYLLSYALDDNSATRVAPIALKPGDFVDEWMTLPWIEAKRWSAENLERWHRLFKPEARITFVQRCPGKRDEWQIGLAIEDYKRELCLTVIRKDGDFYLQSIDAKRPLGCPGRTPAWKDQTHE
jgi:hypothetical protein